MPWVPFKNASQAEPGAWMRPENWLRKKGRPRSSKVLKREQRPFEGNLIIFEDGSAIKTSEAKSFGWLVFEPGDGEEDT